MLREAPEVKFFLLEEITGEFFRRFSQEKSQSYCDDIIVLCLSFWYNDKELIVSESCENRKG